MASPVRSLPLTVFYDGGCPMCAREIAHYRRLAGAERGIVWVDVTREPAPLAQAGLGLETALRRFHVREGERWQVGVRGFLALWVRLPGYRWLAQVIEALRLIRPLEALYAHFADWRFRRRGSAGACERRHPG